MTVRDELMKPLASDPLEKPPAADAVTPEASGPPPPPSPLEWLRQLFSTPTGPGPLETYADHPVNFTKRPWNARIARGLTGFLPHVGGALLDIIVGIGEAIWEGKQRRRAAGEPAPDGAPIVPR